jgi:hypothetical protein
MAPPGPNKRMLPRVHWVCDGTSLTSRRRARQSVLPHSGAGNRSTPTKCATQACALAGSAILSRSGSVSMSAEAARRGRSRLRRLHSVLHASCALCRSAPARIRPFLHGLRARLQELATCHPFHDQQLGKHFSTERSSRRPVPGAAVAISARPSLSRYLGKRAACDSRGKRTAFVM